MCSKTRHAGPIDGAASKKALANSIVLPAHRAAVLAFDFSALWALANATRLHQAKGHLPPTSVIRSQTQ